MGINRDWKEMAANRRVDVMCPHCHEVNSVSLDLTNDTLSYKPHSFLCEPEDGGCDRMFAVSYDVVVTATRYALIIVPDRE